MKTIKGIYNDLTESTYTYSAYGLVFYFSSELYKKKFISNVAFYIEKESSKFKAFYRLDINFDKIFAISYYQIIEKRGFRIINEMNRIEINKNTLSFYAQMI